MGIEETYAKIADWNKGNADAEKHGPVNILNRLTDEQITKLIEKLLSNPEFTRFYESMHRMMELDIADYFKNSEIERLEERTVLKQCLNISMVGTKKEQGFAKLILNLMAEFE